MSKAMDKDIIRFVVFCLECYKSSKGLTGEHALHLFERSGAVAYLKNGYDVLHTLGEKALVDDLDDFIGRRMASAK